MGTELQVLVDALVIGDGGVEAMVVHLAVVGPWTVDVAHLRGYRTALHEDVGAVLLEEVNLHVEGIPQSHLKADICLH